MSLMKEYKRPFIDGEIVFERMETVLKKIHEFFFPGENVPRYIAKFALFTESVSYIVLILCQTLV